MHLAIDHGQRRPGRARIGQQQQRVRDRAGRAIGPRQRQRQFALVRARDERGRHTQDGAAHLYGRSQRQGMPARQCGITRGIPHEGVAPAAGFEHRPQLGRVERGRRSPRRPRRRRAQVGAQHLHAARVQGRAVAIRFVEQLDELGIVAPRITEPRARESRLERGVRRAVRPGRDAQQEAQRACARDRRGHPLAQPHAHVARRRLADAGGEPRIVEHLLQVGGQRLGDASRDRLQHTPHAQVGVLLAQRLVTLDLAVECQLIPQARQQQPEAIVALRVRDPIADQRQPAPPQLVVGRQRHAPVRRWAVVIGVLIDFRESVEFGESEPRPTHAFARQQPPHGEWRGLADRLQQRGRDGVEVLALERHWAGTLPLPVEVVVPPPARVDLRSAHLRPEQPGGHGNGPDAPTTHVIEPASAHRAFVARDGLEEMVDLFGVEALHRGGGHVRVHGRSVEEVWRGRGTVRGN